MTNDIIDFALEACRLKNTLDRIYIEMVIRRSPIEDE